MRIPKMRELYNPILELINNYGSIALSDIRNRMLYYFFINEDYIELSELTAFNGRINNVCSNMAKDGFLEREKQGQYRLTALGKDIITNDITLTSKADDEFTEKICKAEKQYFKELDLLTVATILMHDTRMNNMMEQGEYLYSDGVFVLKSALSDTQEEVQVPLWLTEKCRFYKTADYSKKVKISNDALNWFRSGNDMENYSRALEIHNMIKKADSFDVVLNILFEKYELSTPKLSKLTGISSTTMKRLRNTVVDKEGKTIEKDNIIVGRDDKYISLQNLVAIFIMLRVHPMLLDDYLDVVRHSGSKEEIFRYKVLIESLFDKPPLKIDREYITDINARCDSLMVERVFSIKEKEEITSWDDIELVFL